MEFKDKGPWIVVSETGHKIESDDFTHDVTLTISGDFGSDADRVEYAKGLCEILNRRWIPTTVEMPPSGVPVIAFVPNFCSGGKSRRIRAQYAQPKTLELSEEAEGGEYDEVTGTYYCTEGWYETNEYEDVHWAVSDVVTHWQPLPDVPNI